MRKHVIRLLVILTIISSHPFPAESQIDFSYQSSYKYLKGKDAVTLPNNWKDTGFNDSSWPESAAPFRYGDGVSGTELTDMMNNYTSVYLRSVFICSNKDVIDELSLVVDYDDGFVLWINGTEVLRRNAPSSPQYNSTATANHESGTGEISVISTASFNLMEGENLLAVQALNVNLTSSDFYFDLSIKAEKNYPELIDTIGISFSERSGFFSDPFNVVLTSPDPASSIIYTLDGSNPQTSVNSFTAGFQATVSIDPENDLGRAITPAVVLRASLTRPGYKSSKPESRTYIFIEKVKTQSWPGGQWPSADINGQIIDLEMDSEVVNRSEYAGLLDDALLDIPSISIQTDLKNLFDPASGIYVNAAGHGLNWERDCSVELINPGNNEGFNVNAGLRIRGGWSRHDEFPKHSFRLFFREEYGDAKLKYPLFGDEGADEFDKIDLRCEQNYGWNNGSQYNSFVREIFSRDSQRDIGQPYTRSRYYHLYLNGMYWGLYQTQERPEARYASTYFGGEKEDYDVVKINMDNWAYTIEATDGDLASWQKLYDMCNEGFESNSNYFRIEGKDDKGEPAKNGEIFVNIDNLIDYMLIIFYTGNFDAPSSSFFSNKMGNNFFCIDDRTDKSTGFVFLAHDAEHSFFDEPHSPGIGITEDRVNIASRTDKLKMEVNEFADFHPQWLHYKLSFNQEYRTRFADRAYKCFKAGGVFSPEKSLVRLNKRIAEIDNAVIAESARWGDGKRPTGQPFTRNDNWIPEINKIKNNFIPVRAGIVINQLITANLYSTVKAPVFRNKGTIITEQRIQITSPFTISIELPGKSGTLYYSLDGKDPRNTGGTVNPTSIKATDNRTLTIYASTILKARILDNGSWSPLEEVIFTIEPEDYTDLKITELHYHPPDLESGDTTTSGKDLEFIEFKNTGINSLNLSGLKLDSAVHYIFPGNIMLGPRQFYVIASKPSRFYDFYGLVASGNYQGNLSNAGEEIILENPYGRSLINFSYETLYPWPEEPDGYGYSLSSKGSNPRGDPADYQYWTKSVVKDGTPFADNTLSVNENPVPEEGTLVLFPNPTGGVFEYYLITREKLELMDMEMYDMVGKQVLRTRISTSGSFNLSDYGLSSGIYQVIVRTGSITGKARLIYYK
jgi:hypothetical protein